MSQIRFTQEERIRALEQLGYTEREATFLCLSALHGGYFLRRQYADFLAQPDGGSVTQLIEKTLAKQHVRVLTFYHKTNIYHLCTRPFYAMLGQVDNRNRRLRQPFTIKNKLMGLDFVLAHRDHPYLATEQEKLDYFTRTLQIPASTLPAKLYQSSKTKDATRRYFIDKYPIFLANSPLPAAPPVVSFCFMDEGLTTLSKFQTFLTQYRPLLALLPKFALIYVAATSTPFDAAKRAFDRFARNPQADANGPAIDPQIHRLLEHFGARRLYETKQFDAFDRTRLIQFRNDREELSGPENEVLYERWKAGGDADVMAILVPEIKASRQIRGEFSTYLLEHRYDLFGSLTAA